MSQEIPVQILSDELSKMIKGRRVKVALFTTFTFDPGFFEEDVLPSLFDQAFSDRSKVRLMQLEEALRSVDHAAVYYDIHGLVTSSTSAALDLRRIPMSRPTGYFHPKIVLLLTEERDQQEGYVKHPEEETLIVGVMSANLTQAGWWENVECAFLHEQPAYSRCPFRRELLDLLSRIRGDDRTGEEHKALEAIRKFIIHRLEDEPRRSAKGIMHPRFYTGQQTVAEFLVNNLPPLKAETYNLEVISPYFDATDESGTLKELIQTLAPRETRVFLPRGDDQAALCRKEFYETIAGLQNVKWAKLPRYIVQRTKNNEELTDRFVHAKVYRIWSRTEGREYLLIGSVNLTRAAHSKAGAGNLETAVLLDGGPNRTPHFWLEPLDQEPLSFRVEQQEADIQVAFAPPLSIRYFWDDNRAEYFWDAETAPEGYIVLSMSGSELYRLDSIISRKWTLLPTEVSEHLKVRLLSTSFIEVKTGDGNIGSVLIREEGMAQKPSLLESLTAEEILRYWSLLSPEQREAFLSDKAKALFIQEAMPQTEAHERLDSLFDRFAGIFHAFTQLEEHILKAIEDGRATEAIYRLFGQKYDSLPSLVLKIIEDSESDLVNRYVTLLTAKQLIHRLKQNRDKRVKAFLSEHRQELNRIWRMLRYTDQLKEEFRFSEKEERGQFFDWFEQMFFLEMRQEEAI